MQYHRPRRLNYCVRNGNRCGPGPIATEKHAAGFREQRDLDRTCVLSSESRGTGRLRRPVDVIEPSTVSTAQLRAFRLLHSRPINLVVFQGSLT